MNNFRGLFFFGIFVSSIPLAAGELKDLSPEYLQSTGRSIPLEPVSLPPLKMTYGDTYYPALDPIYFGSPDSEYARPRPGFSCEEALAAKPPAPTTKVSPVEPVPRGRPGQSVSEEMGF